MHLQRVVATLFIGAALVTSPLKAEPVVLATDGAAIKLSVLGQHRSGTYAKSAAEVVSYDPATRRAFVVNAASGEVDALDLSNPDKPVRAFTIVVSDLGADTNSVAAKNGIVAVAVEAKVKSDPGSVALYDTNGKRLSVVQVGALPDHVAFSPNGRWLLVANEGEPINDYAVDPEGSITIVDLTGGAANVTQANVRTADFRAFNGREKDLRAKGVRIFGPKATAAQDFEPEWIEVASDNRTAYASLQENNAIAVIDIESATVTAVWPLGVKDWSAKGKWAGAGFDGSRQGKVNIRHWPVFGIFQPDTIRLFETGGQTYILGANEGDTRNYDKEGWWTEEFRVRDLKLDPAAFPDANALQARDAIGDLLVTSTKGFANANDCNPSLTTDEAKAAGFANTLEYLSAKCVYNALYTFGGRSFSVWRVTPDGLELVWDSGSQMEETILAASPEFFNADHRHRDVQLKRRSVNKGPEPEGIAVGEVNGRTYAFVGLERIGGVMVYDITDPTKTSFVKYINNRDFSVAFGTKGATDTDLGAEGLHFVPATDSPDSKGRPVLLVGNEVSGTTTIFAIDAAK